jgi:hypothetical protein
MGFVFGAAFVWLLNVVALLRGGDPWLGACYLLVLVFAASSLLIVKFNRPKTVSATDVDRLRGLLFSFQGAALAFWAFDMVTTFYAIDVTGLAYELNPLGWPLGILGAAAFYVPTVGFSYVLLYKLREKVSLYAAVPLTVLTLGMCSMNLLAGAQNFQVFASTAELALNVRSELLASIAAFDAAVPLLLWRVLQKPRLLNFKLKNS